MKRMLCISIFSFGVIGLLMLFIATAFIENSSFWMGFTIFKYFSFISNLLVVIYFGLVIFKRVDEKDDTFKNLIGLMVVVITNTMFVYLVFLESLVEYTSLLTFGYLVAHYIVPPLVIGFYIYYRKNYNLKYKDILTWMIFPLVYMALLIIRGVITDDYIYPFFQVSEVGVSGLVIMTIGVLLILIGLSFITVLINQKSVDHE